MKNLSQINENNDIITKEYLEEEGNAATSTAFKMQDIPEGSDLNNYMTPGFYGTRTTTIAASVLNSPLKTAFSLLVMYSYNSNTTNSRIVQIINNYSDTQPKTYMRNIYAGRFGEWEKFIIESDLNEALTGYLPLTGGEITGVIKIGDETATGPSGAYLNGRARALNLINIDTLEITDITELNISGRYYPPNLTSVTGLPDNIESSFVLDFIRLPNTSYALYILYDYKESRFYLKSRHSGTEKEWVRFITEDELVVMTGATTSEAGKSGLVPAPSAGSATRYLRSDGTWQVPPNTTYTLSSFGITATAAELNKLDGATVTVSEINYLDGVESNIQNQLDKKFNTSGGTLTGELIPSAGISHVGKDKYIAYPDGGQFTSTTSSVTGYCKIILPVSWTSTMLKFKISIFNYASGESTDYIVAGYNYAGNNGSWTNCTAYCLGKPGATHSNLPVIFGHNGTKCLIAIGTTTTTWAYPQVTISDLLLGYGSNTKYENWNDGWSIEFNATAISNVDVTINSTNIGMPIGAASTITTSNLTTSRALVSNSSGKVAVSAITSTELGYLDGVKSNIQDQIDDKVIALTQSQYDALKTKVANTLYCIYEE